MLEAKNLSKTYHAPAGDVRALSDFSYSFSAGEMTVIMGPSGSGKSTLLNLLAGLDTPSKGSVLLDGRDLARLSESERAEARLRTTGFVFQSSNLITVLTALQNVAFPMGLAGLSAEVRLERARALLERFGLGARADHLPYKLSGGERQRVSLARALANDPKVVFADEPTGNLDSKSGQAVVTALREVAREGRSVIVVTHDPRLAEQADRVLELFDGQLRTLPA